MQNIENGFKKAVIVDDNGSLDTLVAELLKEQGISSEKYSSAEKILPGDADLFVFIKDENSAGKESGFCEKVLSDKTVLVASKGVRNSSAEDKLFHIIRHLNKKNDSQITPEQIANNPFYNMSEDELLGVLERREFLLWYQPVMDVGSGRIAGFEALIRWKNPVTGEIVYPDSFIPYLEHRDFIVPLGFWIIDEACRQLSEWKKIIGENIQIRIGVNLSARQFICKELAEKIICIFDNYKTQPQEIALEITESAFMEDMSSANLMLLTLKSKNIPLYLDDFGTGFSSLSYLLHFPMHTIKIDKSFVKWMHADEQSEEIVRSIISLAHNLKMKVVAEGVEFEEHVIMLREMGCDYFQGYFFSKPLCVADAELFLRSNSG